MIDLPIEEFPVSCRIGTQLTPGGRSVAVVILDNGDERRPETLGPLGLHHLDRALDEIAESTCEAVVITGTGRTFCAGANLDTLSTPRHFGDALQLAQEGHRVMSRLGRLGVPTIAAINGTALGGGFELALHCTHRVAQAGKYPLGLPEIGLGLIPGWGGATLLPRLIGMQRALRIMVDNAIAGRFLDAETAKDLGAVDETAPESVAGAMELIDRLVEHVERPIELDPVHDADTIASCFERYDSRPGNPVNALTHLKRIVEHASIASVSELFDAEDAALADLAMTPEFRRRLYAFRVSSATSKPPSGTPTVDARGVERVGIVGAGLMASQIALVFAERMAVPVRFTDVAAERLDEAHARIINWLDSRVTKGTIDSTTRDDIVARLHPTLDLSDLADCDLVIEAVFEDLEVKRDVFTALDEVVPAPSILASNTSSLSIDTMANYVDNPSRVAGIHFFNPVAAMKLVEVVRGPRESEETLATAIEVARRLGKTPVIVADRPGFVVNRLLSVFLGESLRLVSEGISPKRITDSLEPLRLPMSPFALIDLIGRVVTVRMLESLERYSPDRFFVGDDLPDLLVVTDGSSLADELTARHPQSSSLTEAEIHDRVVDALAREVRIMLDEGVASGPRDIDLCMMNGAGWPAAIGGLTPYLDGCGASSRAGVGPFHPNSDFA